MSFQEEYSELYDLFYKNKNYAAEVNYLLSICAQAKLKPQNLLELGCGTGSHTKEFLNAGLQISAMDLSSSMLAVAKRKNANSKVEFWQSNILEFSTNQKFDLSVCLFHVFNYLSGPSDWKQLFNKIQATLRPNGLFIFDIWYGPAVIHQRPTQTIKTVENDNFKVVRTAKPEWLCNDDKVIVHFHLDVFDKIQKTSRTLYEEHRITYAFLPELKFLIEQSGLDLYGAYAWMELVAPSLDSWSVTVVVRKPE